MSSVSIQFPADVFAALRKSPDEVAAEMRLASTLLWYSRGVVSQGKAAELAGLSRAAFIDALAESGISANQESLVDLVEILHPRIVSCCARLYVDGHYPQAALEAMKQVEIELKEMTLAPKHVYGKRLLKRAFQQGRGIYLKVPAGEDYAESALSLFKGAFGYYRNYGAHDGKEIDSGISGRVLCLASELLGLLDASELSFGHQGGAEGLVKNGVFADLEEFVACLRFFENSCDCPGEAFDAYWEDLTRAGISEEQEKLFWDLAIVTWNWESIELTEFGRSLLAEYSDAERVEDSGG